MKKFVLLLALVVVCAFGAAAKSADYIYLNNGSVIKGYIESEVPNVSITIRSENGQLYTYNMTEVRKITRKAPEVPSVGHDANLTRVRSMEHGFWCAFEVGAGSSVRVNHTNRMYGEGDFVFGYRGSQYARIGIGVGYRYYFNQVPDFRDSRVNWAIPLYFNLRGNLLGHAYRSIVPYYSIDLGGAFRDGLMARPAIGFKFGVDRSSFLVSLNYTAQQLPLINKDGERKRQVLSFLGLKLGYEF